MEEKKGFRFNFFYFMATIVILLCISVIGFSTKPIYAITNTLPTGDVKTYVGTYLFVEGGGYRFYDTNAKQSVVVSGNVEIVEVGQTKSLFERLYGGE